MKRAEEGRIGRTEEEANKARGGQGGGKGMRDVLIFRQQAGFPLVPHPAEQAPHAVSTVILNNSARKLTACSLPDTARDILLPKRLQVCVHVPVSPLPSSLIFLDSSSLCKK